MITEGRSALWRQVIWCSTYGTGREIGDVDTELRMDGQRKCKEPDLCAQRRKEPHLNAGSRWISDDKRQTAGGGSGSVSNDCGGLMAIMSVPAGHAPKQSRRKCGEGIRGSCPSLQACIPHASSSKNLDQGTRARPGLEFGFVKYR
jgi:hypothetical protein